MKNDSDVPIKWGQSIVIDGERGRQFHIYFRFTL